MNTQVFIRTLDALRPQGWRFEGENSYASVVRWEGDDPIPTEAEFDAKYAELAPAYFMQELRVERDKRLAETDWVIARAVDASNDGLGIQLPQVWVEYRQALRDLPANTVDPANPVWPEKPQ